MLMRQGRTLLWPTTRHRLRALAASTSTRWYTTRWSAHDEPADCEADGAQPHVEAPCQDKAKLTYPESPSNQHSDLATFLQYARRTGLDDKSTVYVGTRYEYTVAAALARYGFFLKRIGGASDRGVDLVGAWTLPSGPPLQAQTARVLVQCKAGVQRVGPQHIRELEGAFVGAPAGWRGSGVLGVLVSERAATKGVRDSLGRSRWPMAYVCCSEDGAVSQMLWNRRAEEEGLEGVGVAPKHVEGRHTPELVLMRNGQLVG